MRISDWSSDVCSSDLREADADPGRRIRCLGRGELRIQRFGEAALGDQRALLHAYGTAPLERDQLSRHQPYRQARRDSAEVAPQGPTSLLPRRAERGDIVPRVARAKHRQQAIRHLFGGDRAIMRSEEHTSELQSLMRVSYAVICLK